MDPDLFKKLVNVSYALALGGITVIILINASSTNSESAVVSLISSYGAILTSLLFMGGLVYTNLIGKGNYTSTSTIIYTIFPFILLIVIISTLIFLLTTYFNNIVLNKIPYYYYSFSYTSSLFLALELWLLFNIMYDKGFEKTVSMNPRTFSTILLLGTINMIMVITLAIILKFYSTDC